MSERSIPLLLKAKKELQEAIQFCEVIKQPRSSGKERRVRVYIDSRSGVPKEYDPSQNEMPFPIALLNALRKQISDRIDYLLEMAIEDMRRNANEMATSLASEIEDLAKPV